MTPLRLGVAKTDITPCTPLPLAGFGHRGGNFEAVSQPLYARVFFFEQGKKRRALLVSADLIWWGTDRMVDLRDRIKGIWGLEESSIVLHATHTHSGPQTSGRFTSSLGKPDFGYVEALELTILESIDRAIDDLEVVTVERGSGECCFGINRRKLVGNEITMAPNEQGPIDTEVSVVRFRTSAESTKAVLAHYACHPTTTDDNLVSSEFPGVAMENVEAELGEETVAAYLQGCCGDVRPALVREGKFYKGSDSEVRGLGKTLADQVLTILELPMRSVSPCYLTSRGTTIPLPLQKLPTKAALETKSHKRDVAGEWSRLLLREPERVQRDTPLEMTLWSIADGLSFLAMSAEVVVDYGLFIKRRFRGRILPLPYSNGMLGYLPTASQIAEGGYEARESIFFFGLPSPLAPSLESKLHDEMINLVKEDNLRISEPIKTENVDRLEVQVYKDRRDMGSAAGNDVVAKVRELLRRKERVRIVFAAAPSQNEVLATLSKADGIDWSRISAFHMDEYVGLSQDAPQSFGRFLREALFDAVRPGEVHLIQGTEPAEEECRRYGALIDEAPIDIVCLGIGENGHIAFNDPPVADFEDPQTMKPVELNEASLQQQVNDGLFRSLEEVPARALTLTVSALMSGAYLFCVVPGTSKREAVDCTLRGPVTPECPASVLRHHPDCVLYLDADAYGASSEDQAS